MDSFLAAPTPTPTGIPGPTGSTGATGPGLTPPVIAFAMVQAGGVVLVARGFASLSHQTGIYSFTLSKPPPTAADILPLATLILDNSPAEISVNVVTAQIGIFVVVFTNDTGNNPADRSFSIVVYDLS